MALSDNTELEKSDLKMRAVWFLLAVWLKSSWPELYKTRLTERFVAASLKFYERNELFYATWTLAQHPTFICPPRKKKRETLYGV